MKRYTQIKGLSQIRRLPRLGKIRLGVKVNKDGKEYPRETPFFVVPEEVAAIYGDKPTELDVMLPVEPVRNDNGDVIDNPSFPQSYMFYGASRGLKCQGDGEVAMRTVHFAKELRGEKPLPDDARELIEVPCTCDLYTSGKCKQVGYLQVLLPHVAIGGVYSIVTSSYHSIVDLNSGIDYVYSIVGRVAMVPLKLKREPRITHHDGMKQTHYTLSLVLPGDVDFINQLRETTHRVLSGPKYSLPAPVLENPEYDEGAVVVEGEETTEQPDTDDKGTYARLLARLEAAESIDDVNAVLQGVTGVSSDESAALRKQAAHRVKHLAGKKAALLARLEAAKSIDDVNSG